MTDSELIEKFGVAESRNYAFNLLVRKYQQKIYWHIRKMVIDHDDADDLVQETFIKAWQALDNFRGDAQLYTWLYRIAVNKALNQRRYWKAKKRFSEILSIFNLSPQDDAPDFVHPAAILEGKEQTKLLFFVLLKIR